MRQHRETGRTAEGWLSPLVPLLPDSRVRHLFHRNQFTVKPNVVLADGLVASELLMV